VNEGFEDGDLAEHGLEGRVGVLGAQEFRLSLAVVTQAGCLQDRGKSRDIHGLIQIAALRDRREQCRFGAELPRHGLFQQPVLGDFKGFRSRA
jgi:hypothetical protein